MPLILGIDPGSRFTGYGIIKTEAQQPLCLIAGVIKTQHLEWTERLNEIYRRLCEIIIKFRPDQAAIEKIFFHRNADSALKLGQARGAAIVALASNSISVAEYTPREIKQAVAGYGAAGKSQVQQMITRLLNLNATPETDAADALAVALCHNQSQKMSLLLQRSMGKNKK